MRTVLSFLLRPLLALLLLGAPAVVAQQPAAVAFGGKTVLVMVDSRSCYYCRKWEREVMQSYLNSPEGRTAPLVKRERGHADLARISGLAYTPTFILFNQGTEVGRIVGYGGPDFFWAEIGRLWQMANFRPGNPSTRADSSARQQLIHFASAAVAGH